MYSMTMETTARGVEASVEGLVSHMRPGLFGFFRLPFLAAGLVRRYKDSNRDLAAVNVQLLEMSKAAPFGSEDLIDPDFTIREALDKVKASAINIRAKMVAQRDELARSDRKFPGTAKLNAPIAREITIGIRLSAEMFEIANAIQWDFAEHDADYAKRLDGFVAESAEAAMSILSKL